MSGALMVTTGTFASSVASILPFDFINPPQLVSASFNGSNQYISAPTTGTNSALTFAGDFTVEAWFYPTSVTSLRTLFTIGAPTAATGAMVVYSNSGTLQAQPYGGSNTTFSGATMSINTWYHIALVRSGSIIKLYLNGTANATTITNSSSIGNGAVTIGFLSGGYGYFAGQISNFRVAASAVYTGNFTSPTRPLSPTGAAFFAALGVSPFVDSSTNAITVTNTGTVATTTSSPFSANWVDSVSGIVGTVNSTPTYDSNYGGGINFTEATPTWVDVPTTRTGTGGYTISMAALVPQSAAHYVPLFCGNTTARAGNYIYSRKWSNFEAGTNASGIIGINLDMGKVAWYDFVYNGTSITVYRNGRLLSSGTLSAANAGWLNPLRFGADESTPGNTMATGTLYRMKHQLTALNASDVATQFETVRATYGGGALAGSLSFPGGVAGTRMLDLTTGFILGAGSYTVEGWFQLPDFNNQYALFGANASAGDGLGMMNLIVASSTSIFSDKNGGGGSVAYTVPTMSANTWYHFALTRNGTTEALFINGVRCGTSVTNAINYTAATTRIGMSYVRSWPGYMTNFRAVVGSYVYDPSYAYCTVPIGPLTNITNTKYLMLGAVATTDSSGTNTVNNTGSVTQSSSTKPF